MSINEILVWTGSLIAFGLYLPLILGILRDKIEQSFASWALWATLDLIALISIANQKGNYLFLVFYVIGSTITACMLLYKGQFRWTRFETLVTFLVLVCLVLWCLNGSRWATISSTIAVVISGLPQFKESWHKPDRTTGFLYLGYIVANSLFLLGGKSWTIEECFYPGMMIPLCIAIAFAALRQSTNKQVGQERAGLPAKTLKNI